MGNRLLDFSPRGWGRVIFGTVAGTVLCVGMALYVDSFNFEAMTESERLRAIIVDVLLPMVLAVPMLSFLLIKLRELAVAHHELARVASTDALTAVLNRGAFTTLVDAYLTQVKAEHAKGALLVVDADNFKAINDSFGHDRGDEALRIIAGSISGLLRNTDLVGRIGGEEFGIFLPGTGADQAAAVAERIRTTVNSAHFAPDGEERPLSVSVGGAVFDRALPFNELFRIADQQLYSAKQKGRNRVAVTPVTVYAGLPMAAA